jgi:hypothetical protein
MFAIFSKKCNSDGEPYQWLGMESRAKDIGQKISNFIKLPETPALCSFMNGENIHFCDSDHSQPVFDPGKINIPVFQRWKRRVFYSHFHGV